MELFNNIKISDFEIGDLVEVLSTKDYIVGESGNFIKGVILEIDIEKDLIKLCFGLNDQKEDSSDNCETTWYPISSEVDWCNIGNVIDFRREFRVETISGIVDNKSNESLALIELARVIKTFVKVQDGYRVDKYHSNDLDIFMIEENSVPYLHICVNPEVNKSIWLAQFPLKKANLDGQLKKVRSFDQMFDYRC